MKAVIRTEYGSTDVLSLTSIDEPTPGDGEVLVRVDAAGLDQGVWHLMTGLPYPVRVAGYGIRRPKHPVLGEDLAGTVVAVGAGVTRVAVGDRVFGTAPGTYAEHAVTSEARLVRTPSNLDQVQAGGLATSAIAALRALRDVAKVQPGDRVLILGASGGVGSAAVQLAKSFGAHVTGVASGAKLDFVRSLGADDVIDYRTTDVTRTGRRWDVVIDVAGNRPIRHLRRILEPRGRLVLVGGEDGGRWTGGMGRWLRAALVSLVSRQELAPLTPGGGAEHLDVLAELAAAGDLVPPIDRTVGLADVPRAIEDLRAGRVSGKVVVTI